LATRSDEYLHDVLVGTEHRRIHDVARLGQSNYNVHLLGASLIWKW
jgi:hypothetical protein